MCALLHRDRLRISSVTLDPPASDDGRPWPCPLCGRFQLLLGQGNHPRTSGEPPLQPRRLFTFWWDR